VLIELLLHVVLLIDISGSTTLGFMKRDRQLLPVAVHALASALDPQDAARIGTFGHRISLDDADAVGASAILASAAAHDEPIGGPSPLWDALDASAGALHPVEGRRGVIVITDGRTNGNRVSFAEVLARLERDGIAVFVIALHVPADASPDPAARLRQLAERTGGTYQATERKGVEGAVKQAVQDLRRRAAARAADRR
jgi:hypothetical protein